ncbi:MAG: BCAM0308 family protein [Candidatus Sericytochromatia bacterium]
MNSSSQTLTNSEETAAQPEKTPDRQICSYCGLVFEPGAYLWLDPVPAGADERLCPICQSSHQDYIGGLIILMGSFLKAHREEILKLVKQTEASEKESTPRQRIMAMLELDDRIEITTTYEHLARRIGEAIHHAFRGELYLGYVETEKFIRVRWVHNCQ